MHALCKGKFLIFVHLSKIGLQTTFYIKLSICVHCLTSFHILIHTSFHSTLICSAVKPNIIYKHENNIVCGNNRYLDNKLSIPDVVVAAIGCYSYCYLAYQIFLGYFFLFACFKWKFIISFDKIAIYRVYFHVSNGVVIDFFFFIQNSWSFVWVEVRIL